MTSEDLSIYLLLTAHLWFFAAMFFSFRELLRGIR